MIQTNTRELRLSASLGISCELMKFNLKLLNLNFPIEIALHFSEESLKLIKMGMLLKTILWKFPISQQQREADSR